MTALLMYIAPFAVWILLQTILPPAAECYAIRSAATALAAAVLWRGSSPRLAIPRCRALALSLLAGFFVAAFWILPEECAWYRRWVLWPFGFATPLDTAPSPYDPVVCGWPLAIAKLLGSAFVIAPVEEVFFRSFLYRRVMSGAAWRSASLETWNWSAVAWTCFIFSLEHSPRFAVAALCALVYQYTARKCGLAGAIIAHVVTNLVLGIYVIVFGKWNFW